MIRITISLKKDSGKISAQGHAGAQYGAAGSNLLCCAISTLLGAVDVNLEALDGVEISGHANPGDVLIEWKHSDGDGAGMELANQYATFLARALRSLAEHYPGGIDLIVEKEGDDKLDVDTRS